MAAKSEPKGEFTADISDDLVAEALRAVEERAVRKDGDEVEGEARDEEAAAAESEDELIEVAGDTADDDGEEEELLAVESSPEPSEDEPADEGAASLEARIAELEEELQTKQRLLDESLQRGREMMERLQEASDRYARQAADLDNARKRALREKEEGQRFAIERLLRDLLPVLDNFDRALEHAQNSVDLSTFSQGVEMTRKHFIDTLAKFGVNSFEAVGKDFDPNFHEAMEHVESEEHGANVVLAEMVRGYTLHERLIRPALVSVSKGPGKVEAGGEVVEPGGDGSEAAAAGGEAEAGPDGGNELSGEATAAASPEEATEAGGGEVQPAGSEEKPPNQ